MCRHTRSCQGRRLEESLFQITLHAIDGIEIMRDIDSLRSMSISFCDKHQAKDGSSLIHNPLPQGCCDEAGEAGEVSPARFQDLSPPGMTQSGSGKKRQVHAHANTLQIKTISDKYYSG